MQERKPKSGSNININISLKLEAKHPAGRKLTQLNQLPLRHDPNPNTTLSLTKKKPPHHPHHPAQHKHKRSIQEFID